MPGRLSSALLYVKIFPQMRDFYAALLNVAPVNTEWTESWADFGPAAGGFALHAIPEAIASGIAITHPPEPRESVPVKLTFAIEQPLDDTLQARLLQAGAARCTPRSWDGGWDVVDPEGNIISLIRV